MVVVAPAVLGKARPVALFDPHRSIIVIVTLHFFSFSFFLWLLLRRPRPPRTLLRVEGQLLKLETNEKNII